MAATDDPFAGWLSGETTIGGHPFKTLLVWEMEHGSYAVPSAQFEGVRFRRDGAPDMRHKKGRQLIAYLTAMDRESAR